MTDGLRLRTFGALVLERERADAPPEVVYRAGKLLALLLHLSVHRGAALARAQVADLLWGDEAPERARASLRQAINSLTRLLGPEALAVTRTTVMLRAEAVPSDRERFVSALASLLTPVADESSEGSWTSRLDALATYRGPFLADEPRISEAFDGWVLAERQRLRAEFLHAAVGLGEVALARGAGSAVLRVAAIVRAAEPEEALWAELAFDGHALLGAGIEARRAIEEFRAQRARPDEPLPAALAARLERVRRELERAPEVVPALDAVNLGGVGTTFIGRVALVERLTEMAERARRGVSVRALLSGPSGVGKTRILDEFEARLRLRGARVLRTRLLPAMRDVPFAGIADVTRGLAALPGALGIAESSAAALVDFLPELRARYRVEGGASVPEPDRVRRRVEAFRDLVGAVGDERLLVLILDDVQHLDARARQAIEQLVALQGAHALILLAARPPVAIDPAAVEPIEVPAFGVAEIRALLTAAAPWPAAPWADALLVRIAELTLGLPQRVIELIRVAEATGVLECGTAGWTTPDPATAAERIGALRDLREVLGALDAPALLLLRVLRIWGRPMLEEALLGTALRIDPTFEEEVWRTGLRSLESLGFVVAGWNTWSIAHDSVGESLDGELTDAVRGPMLDGIVRHLLAGDTMAPALLSHVALLCGQADRLPLLREVVAEVTRRDAWRRQRIGARRFCRQMASAAGRPEWEGPLYRQMGWVARQSRTALGWYAALGATLLLTVSVLTVLLWPRLIVEVEPMGEDVGPAVSGNDDGERALLFYVQPRVSVQNAFGMRFPRLAGLVRAETPFGQLRGDSLAPLVEGRAQFRELGLQYPPITEIPAEHRLPHLRFRGPGIIWRSRAVAVRGAEVGAETVFKILRTVIDGRVVPPDSTAVVMAGDSIRVELTFEYTTTGATANYVVAGAPSWDPSPGATIRIAGLPRPVQGAWQTVRFILPPAPAGHGHVVIAFGAEDSAEHLMSATNWAVGPPVWGDGNDLVRMSEAEVQAMRRRSLFTVPRYLYRSYPGRLAQVKFGPGQLPPARVDEAPQYGPFLLRGASIEFDVTPRSTSAR